MRRQAQWKKPLKDGNDAIVADLDAEEVLQPSIRAFDFPSSSVASKFAFVLNEAIANVSAIGHDRNRFEAVGSASRADQNHSRDQQSRGASESVTGHDPNEETTL